MPNFDGMGPQGQGPQTGRGFGPCNYGGRNCWRRGGFFSKKNELSALQNEKAFLEEELAVINEEIKALEE